jgi:arsenite-transporting ATPase
MGQEVYGDLEPTAILHREDPMRVKKRGTSYVLSLRLPFAERADLEVFRKADELYIRVGSYKRNLALPQTLQRLDVKEASFVEDRLEVRFARDGQPNAPVSAASRQGRRNG